MKTIKQGGLYRYYKNDQDWAVVMTSSDWNQNEKLIQGQVIDSSKVTSLFSRTGVNAVKGAFSALWPLLELTHLPNCKLSFVCKPKNPKKEKELVVEGAYYFETTKGKKR